MGEVATGDAWRHLVSRTSNYTLKSLISAQLINFYCVALILSKCMRYLTVHRKFGPVPYTLHVFGVKFVFRLSLSLPRKIVIITFMHCKAAVRIKVG